MMAALALVLSFLENMLIPDIPFLPVGAKPGLSNVVTMYVATVMGFPGAICITLVKGVFALLTRGATAAFMSLSGGILSTCLLCLVIKLKDKVFSFVGIGIICATAHNIGQLMASTVISGTYSLINYAKYLLIFSLITGSITGFMLTVIMPRIEKLNFKQIKEMRR